MGKAVEASQVPIPDGLKSLEGLDDGLGDMFMDLPHKPYYPIITEAFAPAPHLALSAHGKQLGLVRATRSALAVERYRLAKSSLPEVLDELVPEYIEAIPEDPFDGKPLRYKKLDKGYVVYSIGPDGKDDGGAEEQDDEGRPLDVTFTVER